MLKIAVLDDYQNVALAYADWSRVQAENEVVVFDRNLKVPDEAAEALADFDAICLMRERMPVPAALIERLPKLKLICNTGGHNRTLDLAAATAKGIVVSATRNPGTAHATAELTWALILAAARGLTQEAANLRAGRWQETVGTSLHGRRLGVVGLGRIGEVVAGLGRAFGMEVVGWSPNLTPERAEAAGVRLVSKEALFAESDVITLHIVLSDRTRGLVGAQDLARMKRDAILVNTSRGPLIEEGALIDALRSRTFAMAGLDVFDEEPLPADHPFRTLPNVVATPHIGYVVREAYEVFYRDTVENLEAFIAGAPVRVLKAG